MTTPEQDVLIAKWVAALRSGDYKQHRGELCDQRESAYCCLGVAGKLIGLTDDDLRTPKSIDPYSHVKYTFGLSSTLGHLVTEHNMQTNLAFLNDTFKTFSEIADIIESRPEGLFQ